MDRVFFFGDAKAYKGKPGTVKADAVEAIAVTEIVWNAPEPKGDE